MSENEFMWAYIKARLILTAIILPIVGVAWYCFYRWILKRMEDQ